MYLRDGSAQTLVRAEIVHTETEFADQTFTHSQSADIGPTNPSDDPITPGAWQGSQWSARCDSTQVKSNPGSAALEAGRLNH